MKINIEYVSMYDIILNEVSPIAIINRAICIISDLILFACFRVSLLFIIQLINQTKISKEKTQVTVNKTIGLLIIGKIMELNEIFS